MPLASLTQFILTLIFGSIELFVQILQSPIGNILATRRRFADEKTPSSDMSTPRKNQFSTSGKRVDRSKSKAALGKWLHDVYMKQHSIPSNRSGQQVHRI